MILIVLSVCTVSPPATALVISAVGVIKSLSINRNTSTVAIRVDTPATITAILKLAIGSSNCVEAQSEIELMIAAAIPLQA